MLSRTLVFALAGGLLLAVGCSEPDTTAPPEARVTAPAFSLATPIYPDGMIGYWKFDETDGGTAHDVIGSNHGEVIEPQWTDGIVNGALTFDRIDYGWVKVPDDPSLNPTSALSIEAWLNWQDPVYIGSDYAIVVKQAGAGRYGYWLYLVNGKLSLMIHNGEWWSGCNGHISNRIEAPDYFPLGGWHHAVGVFSGPDDFIGLYIDGQLVEQDSDFQTELHNELNDAWLSIGARLHPECPISQPTYMHNWEGRIDEVAIYDRALSPEEIQQHYLAGLSGHGYELSVVPVEIDIKPGSDPNSINCGNMEEAITVAILTTDAFDALTVDHASVAFAGAGETHVSNKTYEVRRHEEDVDGDGDTDLVLHFRRGDTSLTCESTQGTLTGETYDGVLIEGTDAVRMIG